MTKKTCVAIPVAGTIALFGCMPHPMICNVRVRAEIGMAEDRVLSVQMVTPSAVASERVICHAVFTAAMLEASQDSLDDFLAGHATPAEVMKGDIKVVLQESGKTRVLQLAERGSAPQTVRVEIQIPPDLKNAKASWATVLDE